MENSSGARSIGGTLSDGDRGIKIFPVVPEQLVAFNAILKPG